MPDRHIPLAIVRVKHERFVCVTLYDLPRGHLEDLVSAFEKRGTWDKETALAALREGIDHEITHGAGLSEGEIDGLVAQKSGVVGPALWFLKHHNQRHIDCPPATGWIVEANEDHARVVIRPIDDEFLAWVKRRTMQ